MPVFSDGQKISAALAWDRMIQSVPASYMVWKDGNTYRAECLLKGGTDYSGTDAATVIQSALDALTSGGSIFIKKGTYTIADNPISITNKNKIAILSDNAILKQDGTAIKYVFEIIDSENIIVKGLWFSQEGIADDGEKGTQFPVRVGGSAGSKNVLFKECHFLNGVDDCLATGATTNLIVEDCVFDTAGEHIIYLTDLTDAVFKNCRFLNWAKKVRGYAPKIQDSTRVTFEDCYWEQNEDGQGHQAGAHADYGPYMSVVANCTDVRFVRNTWKGDGTADLYPALDVESNSDRIYYIKCEFLDVGNIASDKTGRVYLIDCYFDMTHTDSSNTNAGVDLIQHCTFVDPTAFYFKDYERVVDCSFNYSSKPSDWLFYVGTSETTINHVTIDTCRFVDYSYRIINTEYSVDTKIRNCYFSGGVSSCIIKVGNQTLIKDCWFANDTTNGVYTLSGTGNDVILCDNYFGSSLNTNDLANINYAKIEGNINYVTENSGTATISASTYVDVTHGLAGTPTTINVTPATSGTGDWCLSNIGDTTFRINVANSGTYTFYWTAEYKP